MKFSTAKRILALFCVNHILAGTEYFELKRKILNGAGFEIGAGTKVVGPLFCSAKLVIGENCWIGRNLSVNGNGTVIIGNNCDIAPEVAFLTGGHEIGTKDRRAGSGEIYTIRVEDGCWIGARATLGKEICVGTGSVVASCACVMDDVPENSLTGGVPAKVIRKLNDA